MALDKPSFKDVKDMSLGTGTYYGFQEKQIDIPFMEAGDRFSAIINGFSLNIPYFTDLITTIDGIALAIKSAPDIRDTFTSTPSVSYGYTINSPVPIRIQSDVDGQEITILNPIITKADTSVIPLNVSIVSPLKEYSYLPVKSIGGGGGSSTLSTFIDRKGGTTSVSAPYNAINVIAYSSDVTINGEAIASGTSWGVSGNAGESFSTSISVAGTDYLITIITTV